MKKQAFSLPMGNLQVEGFSKTCHNDSVEIDFTLLKLKEDLQMDKMNILLCCGAGMSSGFLAQQTRIAAKKKGIIAKVEAKSQNNIEDDLPEIDILLIGPHLSYAYDELKKSCDRYNVPVLIIPKEMYAGLDGTGLLQLCIDTLEGKE